MEALTDLGTGVHQLRLPLPFPSPRHVNAYLFVAGPEITLLDCGVNDDPSLALITEAVNQLGGELTTVIGSHLHVDHIGMAKRLVEATGAKWVMHESTPAEVVKFNDWDGRRVHLAAVGRRHGAPPEFTRRMETDWSRPDWYDEAISPTHPVAEGDHLPIGQGRRLDVLYTPGHQANHICLVDTATGILYSGDHVLPRISPFVPYAGPEHDTLGDYLASIDRIQAGGYDLTHPAHGSDIERGAGRAAQIAVHHRRRLESMLDLLRARPQTAWEVMAETFRPNLSFPEQRLALQETLSHLNHLCRVGRLREQADGDIHRFRRLR